EPGIAMSLRTRLILAFLLLSVVPLTAVTAQHYVSSLDTLHRVARRDAEQMTLELGQRMETVKTDLGQRVEQLWADNRPRPRPRSAPRRAGNMPPAGDVRTAAMTGVAEALGETAALLERIEFRAAPAPPAPPDAGMPAGPDANPPAAPDAAPAVSAGGPSAPETAVVARTAPTPRVPAPPAAPAVDGTHLPAFVIEMKALRKELERSGVKVDQWTPELERLVARGIGIGVSAAAGGLKAGARAVKRVDVAHQTGPAPEGTAGHARAAHTAFTGGGEALEVTMQADGKPVGKVDAKLRLDRVLGTVLSNTRRESGEVAFAIDPKGAIVAETPEDRAIIERLGITKDAEPFASKDGWIVVTRDDPAGSGARFGIARRIGDSVRDLRVAAGRDLATGLGVIGLALVGIFPISGRLTRNVRKLHDGVNDLARGNYAARVDVRSKDEVGRLAAAFNQMAADIEQHQKLSVEQERLKRELELCRQIQNDMLPREPFRAAFADVRGISLPAREVGGDFFNYFTMGDGDLAVLVGDVSGKGVSAALTMANVQATLKARLPLMADLSELVDSIDHDFEKSSPRGVYATLFAAVLDSRTRILRYVNAGHHPQFVLRVDGSIVRLPSTGMPIGMLPGQGYVTKEIALAEGDLLFFYTDGAVETENDKGEMFGAERLEALLVAAHNDGVDAVLERAEAAVRQFRGSAEPFDDATMMALRVGR
ncbi:MAG TPA: PP2C family protein-serine/threonine phosphatase, partial [Vicinamibacterales bacterium]